MLQKILIYTFYNPRHITFKLVNSIDSAGVTKMFLGRTNALITNAETGDYDFILGLGDYRRDSRRIRVEDKFVNKYGRNTILSKGQDFYPRSWDLRLSDDCYSSAKASNGPCNRSAYLLAEAICCKKLKAKLAFVHVPSSYSFESSLRLVKSWVEED